MTLSGRSYPSFGQKLEGNWERVQDDPSGLTNRLQIAEIGFEIDTGTSIFYYKSSSRSSENKYTFNVADIGLGRQNNVYKIEFFRDDEPFFETLYRVTESDNGSETLELQNVLAGSSLPEQFEPDLTFQKSE